MGITMKRSIRSIFSISLAILVSSMILSQIYLSFEPFVIADSIGKYPGMSLSCKHIEGLFVFPRMILGHATFWRPVLLKTQLSY
jgi:hypothetical protein